VTALALAVLLAQLAGAPPATPAPPLERFALVVGYNQPPRPDLPRLRYADDDAVRWALLLETFGARVELLTELDEESQRLYGADAPPLHPPARAELDAAMARLAEQIRAARARGAETVLYVIYAGHGDVDGDEGYVAMADGRLTRRDLERHVLGVSPAHFNHVIVDACRAYYFVYDRGPGGTRRPFGAPYFTSGLAARFANTGFLLASSAEEPTHEWGEFQAGIFSHELRSGLLGAADSDGDGRVTYQEIGAFVRAANRPIRNQKFVPAFVARPPARGGVLLDLGAPRAGVLDLGGRQRRYVLEDQAGVRWADLHPAADQPVTLRLPAARWASRFYLRPAPGEEEYAVAAGSTARLADLRPGAATTTRRGAAHEAFTLIFASPFDAAARAAPLAPDLEAVAAAAPAPDRPRAESRLGKAAVITTVAGGLGVAAAGALTLRARSLRDEGVRPGTSMRRQGEINDSIAGLNRWSVITGLTGAALAAAGVSLLVYDRSAGPGVALAPAPGGALVAFTGRY
jgi:hypothetical protein